MVDCALAFNYLGFKVFHFNTLMAQIGDFDRPPATKNLLIHILAINKGCRLALASASTIF